MAKIPYSHNNRGSLESSGKAIENRDGSTQDKAAPSAQFIQDNNFDDANSGLKWIEAGGQTQEIFCDFEIEGGGWMMVSSNHEDDSTIPSGTNRNSDEYWLERGGSANGNPLIGNGISPNADYIIGDIINSLSWSEVLIAGWDRANTNSSNTWTNFKNNNVNNSIYTLHSPSSLTDPVGDSNVTINTFNTGLDSQANWWIADAVKADHDNGGYDANPDQATIGGAGVDKSDGDPAGGTYFGHGDGEENANSEGWYDDNDNNANCVGWVTMLR